MFASRLYYLIFINTVYEISWKATTKCAESAGIPVESVGFADAEKPLDHRYDFSYKSREPNGRKTPIQREKYFREEKEAQKKMAPAESLRPTGEMEPVFNLPIAASKGYNRIAEESKDLQ